MTIIQVLSLFFIPVSVTAAFIVHWITILPAKTADERLKLCRGAYLGFSIIILLYAWMKFASQPSLPVFLAACGMTAAAKGDFFNLQFPSVKQRFSEPLALGIAAFMMTQGFYIASMLSLVPASRLMQHGYLLPIGAVLIIIPAVLFVFQIYSPQRPKQVMIPAFLYGFPLGIMAAIAMSAAVAVGGYWIAVAVGAGLFLVSDAIMGSTTIKGLHPRTEFQIPWITYLAAQGLIITGISLLA